MNKIATILSRPYTVISAGAVIVVAAFATAPHAYPPKGGAITPRPVIVQPTSAVAGVMGGPGTAGLRAIDAEVSELARRTLAGVVEINVGTKGGPGAGPSGQGSGFIYRPDGWIVTNDHVVAGYDTVKVVLPDGREVDGKVTRANDPQADIAVVKVNERGLTALPLADSSAVRQGQLAMAIGSPFGVFANSVTIGHVSAIGRSNEVLDARFGARGYSTMIQTDAAINPGNSGGPLVNVDGQVIGITTSIFSNSFSGGNQGIGFALPSNQAKVVADLLIANGKLNRGMLGVIPENLKPFEAKRYGVASGAIVREVSPGSPAQKAGMKVDDVVVAVNGKAVRDELDLRLAMYENAPGKRVTVAYVRGGRKQAVDMVVAKRQDVAMNVPPQPDARFSPFEGPDRLFQPFQRPGAPVGRARLGVQVQIIDPTVRRQFGIPDDVSGVAVVGVLDGSPAAAIGIQVGDVIQRVGSTAIATPRELTDAVGALRSGQRAMVQFVRYKDGGVISQSREVQF